MIVQRPRFCPKCREPRGWKKVRPEGARASRFECMTCGAPTKRIKGQHRKRMAGPAEERKALEKTADRLWQRIIHARSANGCCYRCGRHSPIQAAHIFSRRFRSGGLRWDYLNGMPLCGGCHQLFDSDHEMHRNLSIAYIGLAQYNRLLLMKDGRGKYDIKVVLLDLELRLST